MGCFAGLLNLDGAPVAPALLEAMAERLAQRSPDGMGRWIGGAVGMVHGRLWTTPEEVGEEQPIDEGGTLWLAGDLRIDNRSELLPALRRHAPALGSEPSDARLVLAGYRAFGERICDEMLGDFAFALWDADRCRLLLARDAMGMRQLYYARHGATVLFASSIGAVLAGLPQRPPLNRHLIEAFLQDSYRHWIEGTVYEGLRRIAPGHHLTVQGSTLRQRLWWQLGSTFQGSFASEEEWVDGFRDVFEVAVRSRLRSTTPVGLLAGGGVDSAAIAGTAHKACGAAAAGRLRLFALTFEKTPTADEVEYLEALETWLEGVEASHIPADDLPLTLGPSPADDQPVDEPEVYLLRSHIQALFGRAVQNGCRVVLAGEGANQVLGHAFYYDPAALSLVGWRNLAAELPWFRAATGKRTWELLARGLLWPLLPAPSRRRLRRLRRGGKSWVVPAGRGSWRRRLPPLPMRVHAASLSPAGLWAARSIGRPFDLARHSALDVTAAHAGVEWRSPFLDRRVVDLLLHAPRQLRSWRGDDRRILRQAMRGWMPETIRRRRSKSHVKDLLLRKLAQDQGSAVLRLLDKPRAEAINLVAGLRGSSRSESWNAKGTVYGLLSFLSLEAWLRGLSDED